VNLPQGPNSAGVNPALDFLNVRPIAGRQEMGRDLRLAGSLNDQPRLGQTIGERLMHHYVLALLHRRNRHRCVQMIGRHNLHRVDVLFLLQQLAEIGIRGAAAELVRAPLPGIEGVNEFPPHLASAGDARPSSPPIRLAQRPSKVGPQAVLGPVHIIAALLDRIAHGDNLHLGHCQQAGHFPQPLCAAADVGHRDLLARSHKPGPAQHMPRHDSEDRRRRAARCDKLAPGKAR